jgi:hypothetical protein
MRSNAHIEHAGSVRSGSAYSADLRGGDVLLTTRFAYAYRLYFAVFEL